MHAAELMARLNPSTVRYDIGRGGIPELTPQDIAAAIAMVPSGLGRELMCRLWWPEGSQLSKTDIDQLLMEAQLSEWRDRMDGLVMAQLKAECANTEIQMRKARWEIEAAQARAWPRIGPGSCYGAIRAAVLVEMCEAGRCGECSGRGVLMIRGEIAACEGCEGTGRTRLSDRRRAVAIGKDRSSYRKDYAPVYEWLLALCMDVIGPAQAALVRIARR